MVQHRTDGWVEIYWLNFLKLAYHFKCVFAFSFWFAFNETILTHMTWHRLLFIDVEKSLFSCGSLSDCIWYTLLRCRIQTIEKSSKSQNSTDIFKFVYNHDLNHERKHEDTWILHPNVRVDMYSDSMIFLFIFLRHQSMAKKVIEHMTNRSNW